MDTIRTAALAAVIAFLLAVGSVSQSSGQDTGQMQNCPAAGNWSIAVWDGPSGTAAADALATCGAGAVQAAYYLDPQTQMWSRWLADKPELSKLAPLNEKQGLLALGGPAAAGGGSTGAGEGSGQLLNCPAAGSWSIAVWDGASGTAAADAMATCGAGVVAAAYSLDPQTHLWLRWFADKPDISKLTVLNRMQGLLALGAGGEEPPPPPPEVITSEDLIDQALAQGAIDEETALTYKVYAAFGDSRLPGEYSGDDSQVIDSFIMAEVASRFDSLSPQAQATLEPFLLRPDESGSWVELQAAAAAGGSIQAAQQPPPREIPKVWWHSVGSANGRVKVWWQDRYSGDKTAAEQIASAMDNPIWPNLTSLMQEPLPDGTRGGDDRLDIYLADLGANILGQAWAEWPGPSCKLTPTYIVINRPASSSMWVVAHEFMHAIQWSYPLELGCLHQEYDWLAEATAVWAQHYVYRPGNEGGEHNYARHFLGSPWLPLENLSGLHEYGAYLLFFYLAETYGAQVVPTVWQKAVQMDSLTAVHNALSVPGGLGAAWHDFAVKNWNREPVKEYEQWDGLTDSAAAHPVEVSLAGAMDKQLPLTQVKTAGVKHLAAAYYRYQFTDQNVRTVAFYNGFSYKLFKGFGMTSVDSDGSQLPVLVGGVSFMAEPIPEDQRKGAKVQALVKINGRWEETPRDWTNKWVVSFCRDNADERLEELVLIFSNSEYQDRTYEIKPQGEPPTLWVSNMGCWQWEGTADSSYGDSAHGGTWSAKDVIWQRFYDSKGCLRPDDVPAGQTPAAGICYRPAGGTVHWEHEDSMLCDDDCRGSGSGNVAVSQDSILITPNYVIEDVMEAGERRGYEGDLISEEYSWDETCCNPGFDPRQCPHPHCVGETCLCGTNKGKRTENAWWAFIDYPLRKVEVSGDLIFGSEDRESWRFQAKRQ